VGEQRGKYRPPKAGPLQLREPVQRALLALAGDRPPAAELEAGLVEQVERGLRCELPDEILACFANDDDTLPEWGFDLGAVADHTARARELGCRREWIAVGLHPNGDVLYCIERRGDRRRAVGLIEVEAEVNGDTSWRDLGEWLAERAGLETCPRPQDAPVQLTLWPEPEPEPRVWRLV
jgi:hypothetical protein